MLDLGYEDAEVAGLALSEAIPTMTTRQVQCCWLMSLGATQEETACWLNISRQAVSLHQIAGLQKIAEIAKQYLR